MRNGNSILPLISLDFAILVLILPMRNGNPFVAHFRQGRFSFVLILPMRNGNPMNIYKLYTRQISSYPTYEEWKHKYWLLVLQRSLACSYPTYEEWKHFFKNGKLPAFWVLILPMRNGNILALIIVNLPSTRSYPTYEEWKLFSSKIPL